MAQDKTYTSKTKQFIIQQPLTWGVLRDCLKKEFDVTETENGRIIIEKKEDEKNL